MALFTSSFLDKARTVAQPGFNRWLIPPAALAIHLSIGQVYGFSVFNLPMTKLIGITQSAPTDWNLPTLGWIFSSATEAYTVTMYIMVGVLFIGFIANLLVGEVHMKYSHEVIEDQ
ncbi:MAG: hypothetical protein DSM106950_22905 [Stigonema ocellatum SAG 48.90 = DSM 106950]|nr:hypothetical protein [Stigonema ocellatum SAG 48.90 = DSM 106950]